MRKALIFAKVLIIIHILVLLILQEERALAVKVV